LPDVERQSVCDGNEGEEMMANPSDETVLTILTILDLLGKTETPESVTANYRIWQKVLQQRPIK
jgi:hypothetical protein